MSVRLAPARPGTPPSLLRGLTSPADGERMELSAGSSVRVQVSLPLLFRAEQLRFRGSCSEGSAPQERSFGRHRGEPATTTRSTARGLGNQAREHLRTEMAHP